MPSLPEWLAPAPVGVVAAGTFLAAAMSYLLFLAASCSTRMGRGRAPLLQLNRLHLRMSGLYLVLAFCTLWASRPSPSADWVFDMGLGAFFYFGFHYAIFNNFIALAQASVSASIVSLVHDHGGRMTREELVTAYAGGQGFDSIKKIRIARLEGFLGWVHQAPGGADAYTLSPGGLRAVQATRFFLSLWGLAQIGGERD